MRQVTEIANRIGLKNDSPYPLSAHRVVFWDQCASNLMLRALEMTVDDCMWRTEVSLLEVGDVDSKQMMIGVGRVKGGIRRDLPLSAALLGFDSLVPSRLESEIQCAAANPKPNSRTMTTCQRITGVQRITNNCTVNARPCNQMCSTQGKDVTFSALFLLFLPTTSELDLLSH